MAFGSQHLQLFKQMQISGTIGLENCTRDLDSVLFSFGKICSSLSCIKFLVLSERLISWKYLGNKEDHEIGCKRQGLYFDSIPISYVTIILSVGPSLSSSNK